MRGAAVQSPIWITVHVSATCTRGILAVTYNCQYYYINKLISQKMSLLLVLCCCHCCVAAAVAVVAEDAFAVAIRTQLESVLGAGLEPSGVVLSFLGASQGCLRGVWNFLAWSGAIGSCLGFS